MRNLFSQNSKIFEETIMYLFKFHTETYLFQYFLGKFKYFSTKVGKYVISCQ